MLRGATINQVSRFTNQLIVVDARVYILFINYCHKRLGSYKVH